MTVWPLGSDARIKGMTCGAKAVWLDGGVIDETVGILVGYTTMLGKAPFRGSVDSMMDLKVIGEDDTQRIRIKEHMALWIRLHSCASSREETWSVSLEQTAVYSLSLSGVVPSHVVYLVYY